MDTAARHGGDEFAGAAGDKRRRREVSGTADSRTSGEGPAFSVSVGVAGYASDATTIGTLLYAADRALYEMKETSSGTPCALRNS